MSFLYPAFLWAGLALAIPILVHLFNFRRPRKVLFSNLAVVRQVNQVVVQRIKLKQWILLLLRLLAVAAIVLAFAGPIIKNDSVNAALQGARSVVIVIDNSPSMSASDARGIYLQQAKLTARAIVESHDPSDEFQIQTSGRLRLNGPFMNRGQALTAIEKVDYQPSVLTLQELLAKADKLFSSASVAGHVLYMLSDFQSTTVLGDTLKRLPLPDNLKVNLLPVGERSQRNIYLSGAAFDNLIIEKDKPVTLRVTVNNDGDEDVKNLGIRMEIDGKSAAIQQVDVPAQTKVETQLTFTTNKYGWQSGSVTIDDQPIDFDNTRYFALYVPQRAKLLVVEGTKTSKYLQLFYKDLVEQYETKFISERDLASVSLTDYKAIVLAGPSELSSGMSEKLATWVKDGGGLMVFPSEAMNVAQVNTLMNQLAAGEFRGLISYAQPVRFSKPDLSHVLFQGVFQSGGKNAEFDSPAIRKLYDFKAPGGSIQTTVIQDQNQSVVLHETRAADGTVLTFTLFPDLDWSDFPIKSSFAPVLYRATLLLANAVRNDFGLTLGALGTKKIRTNLTGVIKLKGPDNTEIVPEQYLQANGVLLKFDRMDLLPGVYDVYQNDSLFEKVAFNLNDKESQLAALAPDELEDRLEDASIPNVSILKAAPELVRSKVQELNSGQPLWKYFVLLCFLCLVGEVIVLKLVK